jgi:hypothetical protein
MFTGDGFWLQEMIPTVLALFWPGPRICESIDSRSEAELSTGRL